MKDKVYILNIKNMHIEYKTLLNELPMYCLHKIDNGCNEKLKKERTIAWYMLYKLLLVYHNIDLTKCNIYENKNGKPYINDLFFNITHSKDFIGIIISNQECGIDIEKIELKVDKERFAKKILNDIEYQEFLKDNSIDFLIQKWTKIETYYKIIGEGLSFKNININNVDKDIYTIKLDNDYYLSYGPNECDIVDILELNIL